MKKLNSIEQTYDSFGGPSEEALAGPPTKGDILIREPYYLCDLSTIKRGAVIAYCDGYYYASKTIVNRLLTTTDKEKKDSLIYPALFLFRQYLELIMKDTIHNYKVAEGEIADEQHGYKSEHSLETTWQQLKEYLPQNVEEERNAVIATEQLIKEVNKLDHDSMSTRYPHKKGKTPESVTQDSFNKAYRVDVKNMYNVMLKLNNYFEGISELSYVKKDNYSDMFYP